MMLTVELADYRPPKTRLFKLFILRTACSARQLAPPLVHKLIRITA
jgi:hypothetical protein